MSAHVVVIGAYGSAGVTIANRLVDEPELELTLIDDGDPGGGLCILRGCMPSKDLLSATRHCYQARRDDRLDGTPDVNLSRVVSRKNEHVENFAAHRRRAVQHLAEREGVEFIHDTARFVDDRTVAVGDREIDADYVVIAIGSQVTVPDLPGIDDVPFLTSADVLDATGFGETGVVMGFGYVGVELIPYLSEAAGMDLTVIEHDDRPLNEGDPAFGDRLLDIYREKFDVEVRTNTREQFVESTDGGLALTVERDGRPETIEADQLFAFTGRRPATEGLGLENTSLEPGEGWVDDTLRAREDSRVFVVGDANGKEPLLHVAKEQAITAADNLLADVRGEELTEYHNVTHQVLFAGASVYPFARVGLTERAADEEGRDFITVTREADDLGAFIIRGAPLGLAKLVVDRTDGTVLGYQGLHYHADVMAKTMQVVIECGLDVRDVPDRAFHPTTPEILDGLVRDATDALRE